MSERRSISVCAATYEAAQRRVGDGSLSAVTEILLTEWIAGRLELSRIPSRWESGGERVRVTSTTPAPAAPAGPVDPFWQIRPHLDALMRFAGAAPAQPPIARASLEVGGANASVDHRPAAPPAPAAIAKALVDALPERPPAVTNAPAISSKQQGKLSLYTCTRPGCGATFSRPTRWEKRSPALYCSQQCAGIAKRKEPLVVPVATRPEPPAAVVDEAPSAAAPEDEALPEIILDGSQLLPGMPEGVKRRLERQVEQASQLHDPPGPRRVLRDALPAAAIVSQAEQRAHDHRAALPFAPRDGAPLYRESNPARRPEEPPFRPTVPELQPRKVALAAPGVERGPANVRTDF